MGREVVSDSQYFALRELSLWANFLPLGPTLWRFYQFPVALQAKSSAYGSWVVIGDSNYSIWLHEEREETGR